MKMNESQVNSDTTLPVVQKKLVTLSKWVANGKYVRWKITTQAMETEDTQASKLVRRIFH